MITLLWITTASLFTLWSLALWGTWALLCADPHWVDGLQRWLDGLPLGDWLAQTLPGWADLLITLIEIAQRLVATVAWMLPWALGAAWLLGSGLLLALSGLLHWLIRAGTAPVAAPSPAPAADQSRLAR